MLYEIIKLLAFCLLAYLLGSFLILFWLDKFLKQKNDSGILQYGSGNPGLSNFWRKHGFIKTIPAAVLEFSRAAIPGWLATHFFPSGWHIPIACILCIFVALGVRFSIFFKFKGGKSVAVFLGALLPVLGFQYWGLVILSWIIVLLFFARKTASLASLIVSAGMTFLFFVDVRYLFLMPVIVLIWVNHKDNIKRLKTGTEKSITRLPEWLYGLPDIPSIVIEFFRKIGERSPGC